MPAQLSSAAGQLPACGAASVSSQGGALAAAHCIHFPLEVRCDGPGPRNSAATAARCDAAWPPAPGGDCKALVRQRNRRCTALRLTLQLPRLSWRKPRVIWHRNSAVLPSRLPVAAILRQSFASSMWHRPAAVCARVAHGILGHLPWRCIDRQRHQPSSAASSSRRALGPVSGGAASRGRSSQTAVRRRARGVGHAALRRHSAPGVVLCAGSLARAPAGCDAGHGRLSEQRGSYTASFIDRAAPMVIIAV